MPGAAALLRPDMTYRASRYAPCWDRPRTAVDPAFPDDAALAAAYAVSQWAFAVVGPFFWFFLTAGFLAAELGSH